MNSQTSGAFRRLITCCTRFSFFAALVISCATPLIAAELKPPLQALRHANFTLIVAERAGAVSDEHRMPVRVIERLRGDAGVPERIELLLQPGDERFFEPGQRYLVFYSDVERVNFKVRKEMRHPDRRKLLHLDGADPAVYPDTSANRAIFDPVLALPEEDPQYRAVVMQGLRSDQPEMVDLWSAEWALRPGMFAPVQDQEVAILKGVVDDPAQRASARARILEAGAERTPPQLGRWYVRSASTVLAQADPEELNNDAGLSALVYACLRVARAHPDERNASQLKKWLRATPPLAERAALALGAISPGLERESVQAAIEDEGTPGATRSFLDDHLRRMDLAQAKSR